MSNNLKFNQNDDGSYTIEWDRNDPEWKWLNNLTSKEIEGIVKEAINLDKLHGLSLIHI